MSAQPKRFWKTTLRGTTTWHMRVRCGQWTVGGRLIRHVYTSGSSDRWVLQPEVIYDR